jgi:hypothetical protein
MISRLSTPIDDWIREQVFFAALRLCVKTTADHAPSAVTQSRKVHELGFHKSNLIQTDPLFLVEVDLH